MQSNHPATHGKDPKHKSLVKLPIDFISQHEKLHIRISSEKNDHLTEYEMEQFLKPVRSGFYFFMLLIKGSLTIVADFSEVTFSSGEVFFVLPNQVVHVGKAQQALERPAGNEDYQYYKLGFDDTCMSLLAHSFKFIVNPFGIQVIHFDGAGLQRVQRLFENLNQMLNGNEHNATLILAHLSVLLTELDAAYFRTATRTNFEDTDLALFIRFKVYIEEHLFHKHNITEIAQQLMIPHNRLYTIVKQFTDLSPKEYLLNRIILEAQRRIYYFKPSVKELAHELGFVDPDYLSRIFKKKTGKSVNEYSRYLLNI